MKHPIDEIIPKNWRVERVADVRFPGGVKCVVTNEYGRQMVTVEDTPLTMSGWRAFSKHLENIAEARGWLEMLQRLAPEPS